MSIVWQYLDKKSATIKAIQDYRSMQYIVEHTPQEIKEIHEDMESLGSPSFDDMPKVKYGKSNEDRMVKGLVAIDVLQERYRQGIEYMNWFQPAWEELSEEEQYVLTQFYVGEEESHSRAVYRVCETFNIERSSAYNKKNRTLEHLAVLLYGRK